jgi:hypothetical protein
MSATLAIAPASTSYSPSSWVEPDASARPPAIGLDHVALSRIAGRSSAERVQETNCYLQRDPVADYDEKVQFARVRFGSGGGGGFGRRRGGNGPGWSHDYPEADCQILSIMQFVTLVDTDEEHHVIVDFGDPAIFRYPFVYVSEAGDWFPTDQEVENFRNYLLKGGFVVFDDFDTGRDQSIWEAAMFRVLPDLQYDYVDGTSEIYNVFFEVPDPFALIDRTGGGRRATYIGLYLENDPTKRLLGIANLDQDIGEFWEYSAQGLIAIDLSNEAFKLGVNYMIYALTH